MKKSVADEFTAADKGGKLPERVKDGKPVKSRGEKVVRLEINGVTRRSPILRAAPRRRQEVGRWPSIG